MSRVHVEVVIARLIDAIEDECESLLDSEGAEVFGAIAYYSEVRTRELERRTRA